MQFRPTQITMPSSFQVPKNAVIINAKLELRSFDYPHDYTPTIKELEANFEMAALEAAHSKSIEEKTNMLIMIKKSP